MRNRVSVENSLFSSYARPLKTHRGEKCSQIQVKLNNVSKRGTKVVNSSWHLRMFFPRLYTVQINGPFKDEHPMRP